MASPGNSVLNLLGQLAVGVARQCAGLCTFVFCFAVTALAMAGQNPFDPKANASSGRFKEAPKPPSEEEAEVAAEGLSHIMGIHVNTIFFVTAAVIGIYWFTMGGGRKAKVSRDST